MFESVYGIYEWGLDAIRFIQQFSNPVTYSILYFFTFLGNPISYVIFLSIMYLCIDEKKAVKLAYTAAFAVSLNTFIKDLFKVPRPYVRDVSLKTFEEDGYSTPSGHAQTSSAFWIVLAPMIKTKYKKTRNVIIGIIIFLIGLSRVFFAVHYPTDVLFGWVIGVCIALLVLFFWDKLTPSFNKLPHSFKMLCIFLPVAFFLIFKPEHTSILAIMFSIPTGYLYLQNKGGFDAASGTVIQKILRLLFGYATTAALYYVLGFVVPEKANPNYRLLHFAHMALCGGWFAYAVPLLCIKMKLAAGKNNE